MQTECSRETLITATISSPPPHLTLPCPGLLPQSQLCSRHLPGLRHALQPLIALWLPSPPVLPFSLGPHLILFLHLPSPAEEIADAFAAASAGLVLNSDYCAQQTNMSYLFLQPPGYLCSVFPGGPSSRVQRRDTRVGPVKS